MRNSLRYVSAKDAQAVSAALKPVYAAPTLEAAQARFGEFRDTWGAAYPAVIKLWTEAWEEFLPFLALPHEIRRMIYSTNMIESLNGRIRSVVRRHGHFPTEQAARKVVWLNVRDHGPWPQRRGDPAKKIANWKLCLNALIMFFGDRITVR
jgi:putative transposase